MKAILISISILLIISAAVIYSIVTDYDPIIASSNIFYVLYISLIIFLSSILSLIIFWIRIRFIDKSLIAKVLGPSIRQAFLISILAVVLLVLYIHQLFSYWLAVPIILAFTFLELFFQSEKITLVK